MPRSPSLPRQAEGLTRHTGKVQANDTSPRINRRGDATASQIPQT